MTREEDYPEKPSVSKFGLLLFFLIGTLMMYMLIPIIFPEDFEEECDPMDDECGRSQIIVHFIGYYTQTFTNTVPILIQ